MTNVIHLLILYKSLDDVNHTVKGTVDVVEVAAEDVKPSDNQVETQTAYILVPVGKERC